MRKFVALAAVMLVGCANHHPVPAHGHVTNRDHTDAWEQWMPGTTTCTGNPPICSTSPGYPIYWPETWDLEITDLHNPKWRGTVGVGEDVYNNCALHAAWPDCAHNDQ